MSYRRNADGDFAGIEGDVETDLEGDIETNIWQKRKVFALLSKRIQNLKGKLLGIIGKGSIGRKVAKISKDFGIQTKFISARNLKKSDLNRFLNEIDILSIHCPISKYTKDLITLKEMKIMKKDSIIINTARGGIVNEEDLVYALKHKIIGGAGIDVTTKEPPKRNHPYYSINNMPNFIWTPHTAWAADETLANALDQLIENINSFFQFSFVFGPGTTTYIFVLYLRTLSLKFSAIPIAAHVFPVPVPWNKDAHSSP